VRWRIAGAIILDAQHELLFVTRELTRPPLLHRGARALVSPSWAQPGAPPPGDIRDDSARFNVELDRHRCDCRMRASSAVLRSIVSLGATQTRLYGCPQELIGKRQALRQCARHRTRLGAHFNGELQLQGCQLVSGKSCSSRESRSRSCARAPSATSARAARSSGLRAKHHGENSWATYGACETKAANS